MRAADQQDREAQAAGAGCPGRPEASAAWRARRCVLLVDDRGFDREPLAAALRARGVRPMTLPGPERALALLARGDEGLDAVVFPASVAGGANALARRLLELRPELPRVVVLGEACGAAPEGLSDLALVVRCADAADAVGAACERTAPAGGRDGG